ncbi:MAG: DUF1844 domain-containing protein [Phycisphaerae bacterium]|jgi:hypothetical protein|nr:DUF1844 domain-containing protein [Phycisphaerae bacterium]
MTDEKKADDQSPDQPKIIVDDDWKQQAQADKEKLAEQAKPDESPQDDSQPQSDQAPGAGGEQGGEGQQRQLPPATFTTLVSSLATQAMMALGGFADPNSEKVMVDLELAKHHIDTLKVLDEKTKGNLDEEETKLMEQAAYQVQMLFVQVVQHVSGQQPGQQPGQIPESGPAGA